MIAEEQRIQLLPRCSQKQHRKRLSIFDAKTHEVLDQSEVETRKVILFFASLRLGVKIRLARQDHSVSLSGKTIPLSRYYLPKRTVH